MLEGGGHLVLLSSWIFKTVLEVPAMLRLGQGKRFWQAFAAAPCARWQALKLCL